MQNTIQVTAAQLLIALVGAAAISGITTGLILALSQWRERVSRGKELVLNLAIRLAEKNTEIHLELARQGAAAGQTAALLPLIENVIDYHRWLTGLLKRGRMPKDYVRVLDRRREDR